MKTTRTIQIGVMGSMADQKLSQKSIIIAKELGKEIANSNACLLFGFEGDHDSLPCITAQNAFAHGGKTLAFLFGVQKNIPHTTASFRITTGLERGGGREFVLVLSCDVIICIGGGSGTLNEMTIAYQHRIPIISIRGSGGWSDLLGGKSMDSRNRQKVIEANSPAQAVKLALRFAIV